MKRFILKLVVLLPLLAIASLGKSQVRLTDQGTDSKMQVSNRLIPVTLRVSDSQLIDRSKRPDYHKGAKAIRMDTDNTWQTIAIGVAAGEIVQADSIKTDSNNPYYLLPLLKDKGKIQSAANSRWQPVVKKGAGHEN